MKTDQNHIAVGQLSQDEMYRVEVIKPKSGIHLILGGIQRDQAIGLALNIQELIDLPIVVHPQMKPE